MQTDLSSRCKILFIDDLIETPEYPLREELDLLRQSNKYNITVLHDDAFVINMQDKYTIALEPAYFDKTADYPIGCEDNKYILTQQNAGAIALADGKVVSVTEDIRNGQWTCD